jgi:hypothetical protein
LVDEAYADFAETNCLSLVARSDKIMVSRTLSKSYALAGLRFGFLVAQPHLIEQFAKVKDSYNVGALDIAGVSWLDPEQGNVADCYLIAAMIAIAWARPVSWLRRLSAGTRGAREPGNLHVRFFPADTEGFLHPRPFDVPPKVPLDTGRNWIYAHSAQGGETWPALVERAFVMQATGNAGEPSVDDYRTIGTGDYWPQDVARTLLGGKTFSRSSGRHGPLFASLAPMCEASLTRYPTMAWTPLRSKRRGWAESGLVDEHSYAVLGLVARRDRDFVVLRNPYGKNAHRPHFARGEWSEGAPRNGGQPVMLGEHGVFAIEARAFDRWFDGFAWINVPRDPNV